MDDQGKPITLGNIVNAVYSVVQHYYMLYTVYFVYIYTFVSDLGI